MRVWERFARVTVLFGAFGLAAYFTVTFRPGGLWRGLEPALAVTAPATSRGPYDLTRLEAVNETLKTIRDKYVDPSRVHPRDMFLSALNYVQRDVAQVIVLHDEGAPEVTVRVEAAEKKFRIDNILGHWDVSARLRDVFTFLQGKLRGTEVDLREVEYAACNGMLHTLDPHSVFLSPDAYKEMNLSTSGAFGGLGIVISIRDQMLTVMNPMPDTPAGRAGLKRLDRITKINNESTLNMPLDDAVKRLRGEPGTKVSVWIRRDGRDGESGWQGSRPFDLVREQIRVRSVESRLLEGDVGYIRLKQFQSTSSNEVDAALAEFHKKAPNLKGVVLDLRGNPGGLLDQAAKVADKWIRDGVLVATVGTAEGRDEKLARAEGTEPVYPLVVLVNGSSASASEIVAGALKNHDRAVVVGQQTFGKGSVQLVFPDVTPDKAALKLTIAQYLTPGDVSIQGVGITPDIELDPMTVDALEMDIYAQHKGLRERDLSQHLSNSRAAHDGKPLELVRYDLTETERQAIRERGGDLEDQFTPDFPIKFSRELVLHMPNGKRADQVLASKDYIAQMSREEWGKVSAELAKMSIDWADAPNPEDGPSPNEFEVKVETDKADAYVEAGQAMTLKVTVKNQGKLPAYRVRATTKSDNGFLDTKELIFGKIGPGQSKTATAPFGWCDVDGRKPGSSAPLATNAPRVCRIPKDSVTRSDGVKIKFEAAGGHAPADAEIRPTVHGLERPLFEYAYQIADNRTGNGDGRVQKGEALTMFLTVKNVGRGRLYETQANLRNLSGDGLLLRDGRFDISNMMPGEVRKVAFTFDAQQLVDPEAKVELSVGDRDLHEIAIEKIKVAVEPPLALTTASGAVKAGADGAMLLDEPSASARAFGKLSKDAAVRVLARAGDFVKVDLGDGRFAFIAAKETAAGGSPAGSIAFEPVFAHAPPSIDVAPAALATRDPHMKISATISDVRKLLDHYVFVGSRKVSYQSNQNGADPKKTTFQTDVSLRPGINVITVFARQSPDTVSRKTIVVRRDGPNGELLPTPTSEESPWETKEGGDDELP